MASFQAPNGQLVDVPDQYDPKTGENLALKTVQQQAPELSPVQIMVDPTSKQNVITPADKVNDALKLGLIPQDQYKNDQLAAQSKQKVQSGDIGYDSSKGSSLIGGLSKGLSANTLPVLSGIYGAAKNIVTGSDQSASEAYLNDRNAAQSVQTAQEKSNPITFGTGDIVGGSTLLAPAGGSIGALAKAGALYGAGSNVGSDLSKGDLSNLGTNAISGAGEGAIGGVVGGLVGNAASGALKLAGNAISHAISPEAKQAFKLAASGEDLTNPEIQQKVINASVDYHNVLANNVEQIQKTLGQQKGDILSALDDLGVDHTPLINSIDDNIGQLKALSEKTGNSKELSSLDNAQKILTESKLTLAKNPDSATAIDKIKQDIGDEIYNQLPDAPLHRNVKNILQNVRSDAQHYLESQSDNLKGTNVGYKDVTDALNSTGLDQIVPSPSEMTSLGSLVPSDSALTKYNNLLSFNRNIQDNSSISPEVKSNLGGIVSDLQSIAQKSKTAKTIQGSVGHLNPLKSTTQAPIAAMLGNQINNASNLIKPITDTINGIPRDIYNNLPIQLQNAIQTSPTIAQQIIKALPTGAITTQLPNLGNNNGQ